MSAATEPQPQVLVVEDDRALRELLVEELGDAGYGVTGVACAESAWRAYCETRVDLVVSDLRLPSATGSDLLRWIAAERHPAGFIVITAFGTISQAVQAIKAGADEFLTKPLDMQHLLVRAERVLETRRLRRRLTELEALIGQDSFHGMSGRSRAMQAIFDAIRRIGPGEGPVLITGESGTGKELIARAVHAESGRAGEAFVPVNCAGVPASLLESEFFGHVKGAFTGASRTRRGLFLEANGGTLFLDEIAEMPVELQAKLLRVLEEGSVRPVGADQPQPTDIRIVAATNRDIGQAIERGEVRADLYYRLETFHLQVPALRERAGDVELLAMRFLEHYAARTRRTVTSIEPRALRTLARYPFPGNVRELANAIEHAVTFCDGDMIRARDLPDRVRDAEDGPLPPELSDAAMDLLPLAEVEQRYIAHVLARCGGNKRQAAQALGIGRRTLYRKLSLEEQEDD